MAIHKNYLILNDAERSLVDDALRDMFASVRDRITMRGVQLAGDDRAERAAEALATWIVESRSN